MGDLRVHLQGAEERAARVAGVAERDHPDAGAAGAQRPKEELGEWKEVVGLLGLGPPVEDLSRP
ncbi:hypothetical protein GCM10010360_57460 [Streptomyces nogalater]